MLASGKPASPTTEPLLMTVPWVLARWGRAYLIASQVPFTLTPKVSSKSGPVRAAMGPIFPSMPALLNSTSSFPNSFTVASTTAFTSASFATSARMNFAVPPCFWIPCTTATPCSSRRAATTTFAPSRANASAAALPMPALPPRTSTTFESNRLMSPAPRVCPGAKAPGSLTETWMHFWNDRSRIPLTEDMPERIRGVTVGHGTDPRVRCRPGARPRHRALLVQGLRGNQHPGPGQGDGGEPGEPLRHVRGQGRALRRGPRSLRPAGERAGEPGPRPSCRWSVGGPGLVWGAARGGHRATGSPGLPDAQHSDRLHDGAGAHPRSGHGDGPGDDGAAPRGAGARSGLVGPGRSPRVGSVSRGRGPRALGAGAGRRPAAGARSGGRDRPAGARAAAPL